MSPRQRKGFFYLLAAWLVLLPIAAKASLPPLSPICFLGQEKPCNGAFCTAPSPDGRMSAQNMASAYMPQHGVSAQYGSYGTRNWEYDQNSTKKIVEIAATEVAVIGSIGAVASAPLSVGGARIASAFTVGGVLGGSANTAFSVGGSVLRGENVTGGQVVSSFTGGFVGGGLTALTGPAAGSLGFVSGGGRLLVSSALSGLSGVAGLAAQEGTSTVTTGSRFDLTPTEMALAFAASAGSSVLANQVANQLVPQSAQNYNFMRTFSTLQHFGPVQPWNYVNMNNVVSPGVAGSLLSDTLVGSMPSGFQDMDRDQTRRILP